MVDHIPNVIFYGVEFMKFLNIINILLFISSCSGKSSITNIAILNLAPGSPAAQASALENQKLVNAIQATPEYKIQTSELDLLQSAGVISSQDLTQLHAIQ